MQFVYGQRVEHILPTRAEWKKATSLGTFKIRSSAIKHIDRALTNFDNNPCAATLHSLKHQFQTWYRNKTTSGTLNSKHADPSFKLEHLIKYYEWLERDRRTLKTEVENRMATTGWKSKATWGEIYQAQHAAAYGQLQPYVEDLEWEARVCSGWAMNPPADINSWSSIGADEVKRLEAWPQLAAGKPGLIARMKIMGQLGCAAHQWPRFAPLNVRKGVFCHSSAAIAAHLLHKNRAALNSTAHFCRIKSIDIIQQQASRTGSMCHWWVCVNRPDEIRLASRTIRFTSFQEYERYLPIVGGFVVDMWGAMFEKGKDYTAWGRQADHNKPSVIDIPDASLLGRTKPVVRVRWSI